MYVEKLTMKDFRCFEQAEVTFVYPGKEGLPAEALKNVTLLIGINGTGKTTCLKAVALSAMATFAASSGLYPYHLVRRATRKAHQPRQATVAVSELVEDWDSPDHLVRNVAQLTIELGSEGDSFGPFLLETPLVRGAGHDGVSRADEHDQNYPFIMLGYGATRRTEYLENLDTQRSKRRHPRYQRVAGLFEDYITLYPLAAWYPTLESKPRQKDVREMLNGLLPSGTEFTGEFKDADSLFTHNGVRLPFGALSDGFRSYIGLVADMLYHLNYVCPKKSKLTDLSGVVMIDDIDVHLHPKWQREVVPNLAKTFPKLQFIITSHSPLVAGTLHAANIRVVEDNQIHEYTERIHGLSADQILLSSYFGLDSTRAPAAERKLSTMAKRVADTHDPAPAIAFLEELAGKSNGQKPKKKKP